MRGREQPQSELTRQATAPIIFRLWQSSALQTLRSSVNNTWTSSKKELKRNLANNSNVAKALACGGLLSSCISHVVLLVQVPGCLCCCLRLYRGRREGGEVGRSFLLLSSMLRPLNEIQKKKIISLFFPTFYYELYLDHFRLKSGYNLQMHWTANYHSAHFIPHSPP